MPDDADVLLVGGVVAAGAAAVAWWMLRPAPVAAAAVATPRPLASEAEGFRLQATGDGSVLRATRETVSSSEAMRQAALKACNEIPKGLFGVRRNACARRVNKRYANSMVRATRGITGGAGIEGAGQFIGSLGTAAGEIIGGFYGGDLGTTTVKK